MIACAVANGTTVCLLSLEISFRETFGTAFKTENKLRNGKQI